MDVPDRLMVGCAVVFCIVNTSEAPLRVTVDVRREVVPPVCEMLPEHVSDVRVPRLVMFGCDVVARVPVIVPVLVKLVVVVSLREVVPPVCVIFPEHVVVASDVVPVSVTDATDDNGR